jgi:hypothetical protein
MTWLVKADGMNDLNYDDPKVVIERVDELRRRNHKNVRIADVYNNPIDESALRKEVGKS